MLITIILAVIAIIGTVLVSVYEKVQMEKELKEEKLKNLELLFKVEELNEFLQLVESSILNANKSMKA